MEAKRIIKNPGPQVEVRVNKKVKYKTYEGKKEESKKADQGNGSDS